MTAPQAKASTDIIEVTIEAGQSLSEGINLLGRIPTLLHMPASFSGATITFQAAASNGGTYQDVYLDGAEYSIAVAAGQAVLINPAPILGLRFIKIRSGTSASPVTEGAGAVIGIGATIPAISQ